MSQLLSQPGTVLITGTTSGIGAALAAQLLGAGHRVIAVSRRAGEGAPAPDVTAYACDLADPQATEACFARIAANHPDIALVINNAAIQLAMRLDDPGLDAVALQREVAVNLLAPAIIARALLPVLRARAEPTAIVNISSGLAFHPKTTTVLYSASKAALHSLTRSLRYQVEGTPVRVIEAILPLVDTPMTAGRGSGKIGADAAARAIIAGIKRGQDDIYVGKARLLPLLGRIAPAIPAAMLKRA
ncbi:MAG TPA: SDR family NAD(P)-dependent oxidoreductase [Sphingopyxis sp.]|jgi:uncharacterized oxidoreductase|uniref:SDR family NAD(P)-dependent oxidoreductase n=1 Tax=Sphingopyxis sp. TaxID=1908224 RepID=UPI002E15984B|nr:SDR family NAD(P)-dependent oxidoreductase [Sphingopyxis sp.]